VFRRRFKIIQSALALLLTWVKWQKFFLSVPKTDWDSLWSRMTYGVIFKVSNSVDSGYERLLSAESMCILVWRPYGLIYKNPKNGQKDICKLVPSLGIDFQDGLVCVYM
jgi:hypothetical protein